MSIYKNTKNTQNDYTFKLYHVDFQRTVLSNSMIYYVFFKF